MNWWNWRRRYDDCTGVDTGEESDYFELVSGGINKDQAIHEWNIYLELIVGRRKQVLPSIVDLGDSESKQ